MSCNLEQALAKVEKLLKFSAIQKNIPFEIKRIKFEIEAMMAAKKRMLEGPTDETYTTEKVEIDHGTDYTKLITSLENRVKDYVKYVTKDTKNINVHRSTKDANGQTKYLPFGNPFSRWSTGESNDGILSAMFYRWVVNNEIPASYLSEESAEVKAKRLGGINTARKNIITQLKSIANKELYYEGTARDKNLSHASALALIADLYNKGTLTIDINSKQNVLKASGVEVKPSKETTYEVPSEVEPKKIGDKPSKKATPEFDTLPKYKPGQNNMTYAGIGSRETPIEVLELMTKASAWLGAKGYTLQSGGAIGADMAFEGKPYPRVLTAGSYDVVNKKGKLVLKANEIVKIGSEKYADAYYAFTDKATKGSIVGSDWSNKVNIPKVVSFSAFDVTNNKFGNSSKVLNIAKELHTNPEKLTKWSEALMARNTYQVFGKNLDTPVDFVLFYAEEGNGIRPEGGTGQAVEMARLKGIPTINMADANWRKQLENVIKGTSSKNNVKETAYEVSSKGDKNFSALYAKLEDGISIEEHYQVDVKGYKDIASGKNKPPKDTSKNLQEEYTKLWKRYFELYPDRFEFIKEKVDSGIKLTDQFAKSNSVNQADTIMDIVKSKWKPKDNKVDKKDQTIKTISDTSGTDKETPKVEEKEVNELDNSKIKLSNTKDKDGMWVTSNIPIIMYNTNTKNVSKDNKAVVNTVVSSVSRLAGVTWNNEAAVDKLSYVKENSDDKKLQSLLDTVLGIDKELSDKIDSFDLSKRGNSTYSIDSLNDLVYDMADNYERLHNAQEAVFNHLSSEYGVAVTANHKESENVNTGSTTKLFFEQFVPDYMLSKEKTESKTEPKKEIPKAKAVESSNNLLNNIRGYKISETESALDEYLTPDSTPEASTKYENSIIQNNEPKTKHTEVRDNIKKCLLKIGSK